MRKKKLSFMECKSCAAKPGSPTLCPSCLNNRGAIWQLETMQRDMEAAAGELMIPIEYMPPGSKMAQLVIANRIMRDSILKWRHVGTYTQHDSDCLLVRGKQECTCHLTEALKDARDSDA